MTKATSDPATAPTWELTGDFVVAATGGPRLVIAACYQSSPVGPYVELAVAEPARMGTRLGIRVTTMAVNNADSCEQGRRNWGFPKELAELGWDSDGDERILRWEEQDLEVRAVPMGPVAPIVVRAWALQRWEDEPLGVPVRVRGKARLARVRIATPAGDSFSDLDGRRPGAVLLDSTLVVGPARRS